MTTAATATRLLANFNTHITIAAAGAALVSTLCLKAGYVGIDEALLMTGAGTLGGILPDIDLKYSHPSKLLFSLLGVAAALTWMFSSSYPISVLELWVAGLGIYLIVRYPLWFVFHKITVHRGSIHSLAAALLAALLTSACCSSLFGTSPFVAWLIALSMFCGFVLHLLLDEVFSVDFMGIRIKQSFGSALKLLDFNHLTGSSVILVLCIVTWFATPDAGEFVATLKARETRLGFVEALKPTWVVLQTD